MCMHVSLMRICVCEFVSPPSLSNKSTNQQVVMFVKPLEGGQVVLRGVSVEVVSLVTLCRVDKWGRGIAPK